MFYLKDLQFLSKGFVAGSLIPMKSLTSHCLLEIQGHHGGVKVSQTFSA